MPRATNLHFPSVEDAHAWANRNRSTPALKQPVTRLEATEEQEQIALFDWVRSVGTRWSELNLLYHVPNGGFRKRSEAARFAKMGVQAGVPDLHLPVSRGEYHSLYIELKAIDGTPSDLQICRAICLAQQGNIVAFAWGWMMAKDFLVSYLEGR